MTLIIALITSQVTPIALLIACMLVPSRDLMAELENLGCEDLIATRVMQGYTHATIATELQLLHPGVDGLSTRSVRRFCCSKNIHRSSRLSADEVDEIVESAVSQVSIHTDMPCVTIVAVCLFLRVNHLFFFA